MTTRVTLAYDDIVLYVSIIHYSDRAVLRISGFDLVDEAIKPSLFEMRARCALWHQEVCRGKESPGGLTLVSVGKWRYSSVSLITRGTKNFTIKSTEGEGIHNV